MDAIRPITQQFTILCLVGAWIDVLPLTGYDGGMIAGSAGSGLAVLIVLAEILICGNEIMRIMPAGAIR